MTYSNTPVPVSTSEAPAAVGPFAQGVVISNLVFCSGQIAVDPQTGRFVSGGIQEQTKQILRNIGAILKAAGTGLENVVKTTVFLTNITDFEAMNQSYAEFFKRSLPARSTIQVTALPKGAAIEIEAIATIP